MDESAFLDAILKDPLADAPRFALADWLTEREDPRGLFIATQCLRQIPKFVPPQILDPLRNVFPDYRIRSPIRICNDREMVVEFIRPTVVPDWKPPTQFRCSYERGFVETVEISWEMWLWAATFQPRLEYKSLLDTQPIRSVVLRTMPELESQFTQAGKSVSVWLESGGKMLKPKRRIKLLDFAKMRHEQGERGLVSHILSKQWPRIKFHLPIHVDDEDIG
jgi:uncharacterized protein (TIGR02996 family)